MNELIQVGARTYYVTGPFHVGVYIMSEDYSHPDFPDRKPVCLIDSGVDEVVARVIDGLLEENGFYVHMIINTHYHADHSGGNAYFKNRYKCILTCTKINAALMSNYDICPAIVWGASPVREIINKYFYATPADAIDIALVNLPEGISITEIPGHCISMIAVRTGDDVLFLGDAVIEKNTLELHPLSYIYEIGTYLESLDYLKTLEAGLFIPYHAEPVKNLRGLIRANRESVKDNIDTILDICSTPKDIDTVISEFFTNKNLKLSLYKYAVEGGVVKTYVSYLHNMGLLDAVCENNYIKWVVSGENADE